MIHPTAYVDPGAELGPGVIVHAFAYIAANVRIAAGCEIQPHAVLGSRAIGAWDRMCPEPPPLLLGPACRIGAGAILQRGACLGQGCVIGPQAIVAVNATLGPDCRIAARAVIGAGAVLEERCEIGAGALLGDGLRLAPGSLVESGAVLAANHQAPGGKAKAGGLLRRASGQGG